MKRSSEENVQFGRKLTAIQFVEGLPDIEDLHDEILGYIDILLGRDPSPVQSPYLELAEVATAYYARALEIDFLIHAKERSGEIRRGQPYYRFRTGELRAFIDMAKKCADLGSRRLTQEALLTQQRLSN